MRRLAFLLRDLLMLMFLGACGGVFLGFIVALFNAIIAEPLYASFHPQTDPILQSQLSEAVRVGSFLLCVVAGTVLGAACFCRWAFRQESSD